MLSQDDVKKELERFVVAELYTDRQRPDDVENNRLLREEFGGEGMPMYVILTADRRILAKLVQSTVSKEEFLEFLRRGTLAASGGK